MRLSPRRSTPLAIVGIGCLFPKADGLGDLLGEHQARRRLHRPGAADPLEARRLLRRRPEGAGHDLRPPRRLPRPGRVQPAGEFGIAPNDLEATDTSQLLGAGRRAAGARGRRVRTPDRDRFDANRVSVILGVTGTLELVIPLGARLGHPLWRKALDATPAWPTTSPTTSCSASPSRYVALAGELVPRAARQRRRRADRQPPRPGRHQLRRRRGVRQLARADAPGRPGAAARPVRHGRHRRRRHVQRHLHVHVLQQDARPCRRPATRSRSTPTATARCSAKGWAWSC